MAICAARWMFAAMSIQHRSIRSWWPTASRVSPEMLAMKAVEIMEQYRITALPVVDKDNRLVGALNVHDLFRAGLM